MDIELVYHNFDGEDAGSPFEEVLTELADDAMLDIACPYLSLDVLNSLVDRARTWRLVTDLQEWSRTQTRAQKDGLQEFVRANRESIRDCRGLHAKVFLGSDAALVGSANVTNRGLAQNSEMAVRFEGTEEVDELDDWFGELWTRTESPDLDILEAYLSETDALNRDQPTTREMPDAGPSIGASLQVLGEPMIPVDETEHERLVERVGEAPSRDWMDMYFDWVAEVIKCTGVDESDERIATTIPKSSSKLPVNVNHRYVLAAFPKQERIGIILPPDSSARDELAEFVSDFGAFSTHSDEDPYWFEFPGDPHGFISDEIKQEWRATVSEEGSKGSRSEYRTYHSPAVYNAAVSQEYRETVLESAFSSQE
jgi:hypothetical protein